MRFSLGGHTTRLLLSLTLCESGALTTPFSSKIYLCRSQLQGTNCQSVESNRSKICTQQSSNYGSIRLFHSSMQKSQTATRATPTVSHVVHPTREIHLQRSGHFQPPSNQQRQPRPSTEASSRMAISAPIWLNMEKTQEATNCTRVKGDRQHGHVLRRCSA